MGDRDEQLRTLIEAVQRHPKTSLEWRRAMHRLLLEIQQLPGLTRASHPDYGEALDDVLVRLGDEIHEFEPRQPSVEQSLTAWINYKLRLKYRVRELYPTSQTHPSLDPAVCSRRKSPRMEFQAQAQRPPLSLDAVMGAEGGDRFVDHLPAPGPRSLWELEDAIRQEQERQQRSRIGLQLKQYIDDDPEGNLRQCHPQAHPGCHCQMLGQRLLLKQPPDRLITIAREFGINYHTLNWHWKHKGLPLLQAIAQKFGYSPDRDLDL